MCDRHRQVPATGLSRGDERPIEALRPVGQGGIVDIGPGTANRRVRGDRLPTSGGHGRAGLQCQQKEWSGSHHEGHGPVEALEMEVKMGLSGVV